MYRLTTRVDPEFLQEMLYEAAYWRDDGADERPALESMLQQRQYARYVNDWGRRGDVALAALDADGQPLGAAWYRRFSTDDRGFGFVAPDVPELSIAVYPEFRRRKVGSLLLGAVVQRARGQGEHAMSLSVENDNPARKLYERFGFRPHGTPNGSITMLLALADSSR